MKPSITSPVPPPPYVCDHTVGQIVHYVAYNGTHLAAILIGYSAIEDVSSEKKEALDEVEITELENWADLYVLTNLKNTNGDRNFGSQFHQHVPHSQELHTPGTWHLIVYDQEFAVFG